MILYMKLIDFARTDNLHDCSCCFCLNQGMEAVGMGAVGVKRVEMTGEFQRSLFPPQQMFHPPMI